MRVERKTEGGERENILEKHHKINFKEEDKMKKFSKVVLVCFLIFIVVNGTQIKATSTFDPKLIVEDLSKALRNWYIKVHSNNYRDITVNISLAEDIQPPKIEAGKAEAVFYVSATMTPKITLEEASQSPFLNGMKGYLKEHRGKLTEAQVKTIELAIKEKFNSLIDPVGKLHEENGIFKILCNLASDGKIDKNSIKIFYNVSPKGDPIWEDANNSFLSSKSTYDEEKAGYREVEELIDIINRLAPPGTSRKNVSPAYYVNLYNRITARNYADQHTSNASEDKHITCWIDNKPVVSYYTDISYWNNSEYPLTKYSNGYYERLACNNCADFVSQAMYEGGMETDAYWNPSNRKTSYNGKWCWTSVPDLEWRMFNQRGDWKEASYNQLDIGDVAIFLDKDGDPYHIVIDDYSYGYYGVYCNYFDGHTNDVKEYPYGPSGKRIFYKVSCWRGSP